MVGLWPGLAIALGGFVVGASLIAMLSSHSSHSWEDKGWVKDEWDAYRDSYYARCVAGTGRVERLSDGVTIRRGMKQYCTIEDCHEYRTDMRDYVKIDVDELERLHKEDS